MSNETEIVDVSKVVPIKSQPREPKDRVTIVETVTHVSVEHGVSQFDSRFYQHLTKSEQSYERHCSVGTEWKPLDLGWVGPIGWSWIVIQNDEKFITHPDHVLEVSCNRSDCPVEALECQRVINPQGSERTCPSESYAIWVRGRHEITHFTVFAVPK